MTLGARSKALLLWMQGSAAGRRIVSFHVDSSALNLRAGRVMQQETCIYATVSESKVSLPLPPTAATSHITDHTFSDSVTVDKYSATYTMITEF